LKSRHKITLLFTLLVMAILLVVSISVYYFTSLERKELFSKRLKGRANNNAQIFPYTSDTNRAILNRINVGSMELLPKKSVEIYDLSGKMLYQYKTKEGEIGISKPVIEETISNGEFFYRKDKREVLAVHYNEDGVAIIVVVAAYDDDGWKQLHQMKQIFIISLLIGTAIALIAGHIFSKQLLRPVAQIIREVNDISSHNLSLRIRSEDSQDELSQLANTFNELLERLQESFTSQRRFISNASHELSTPLTSISSQLQVTLQRDRSTDEYRQVMQSVQEDVMHMRQLTRSLLDIARTGANGSIELDEIRIDEVLFKVMADIKKINAEYDVELSFGEAPEDDSGFLVFGNSDLLYIAVKNVVENGCKYSEDHTSRVRLFFENGTTLIEVKSNGEGISSEEQEQIFQPFYRSVNAAGTSGFGLGLALAKHIVGLHKGSITLQKDNADETLFIIALPTMNKKIR
jgi:two-component system sensor histidine kinase ArlS